MNRFQFVAVTPPGLHDPAIAIAASRAGALGVLDLSLAQRIDTIRAAIARLARFAGGECGIKIDSAAPELADQLAADLPDPIRTVIIAASDRGALDALVALFKQHKLRVLVEAIDLAEAQAAAAAGADGVIAKGNESGGRIGEKTAFILLQQLLQEVELPVFAHGGIGAHTAAACYAAGAAGAVLDAQLYLTRESPLSEAARGIIAAMDGSETVVLGRETGRPFRVFGRASAAPAENPAARAGELAAAGGGEADTVAAWRRMLADRTGWDAAGETLLVLGQDAAFAAALTRGRKTVGAVLEHLRRSIESHIAAAAALKPLDRGSPLAVSHGTDYPIVQAPMTRVSDTGEFLARVAEAGALPFFAAGRARADELKELFDGARGTLGDRPFGVGLLGTVPAELRAEQLALVKGSGARFAILAGGAPELAAEYESEGLAVYAHAPSPLLLQMFLRRGMRRFIFEGAECGGHVGPRGGFVLWEQAVDALLQHLPPKAEECHVLFAGGIHDARSAAMIGALAAPLAERGIKVGVLMGTAYLFTDDAVATKAVLKAYQDEAIDLNATALIETGPGAAIRCAPTPFVDDFEAERRRLRQAGTPAGEMRDILEALSLGRLRIAAKGVKRREESDSGDASPFIKVRRTEQRTSGLYMIGQLAALRQDTVSIADLHADLASGGTDRLRNLERPVLSSDAIRIESARPRTSDIAIVGMACFLPKAPDLRTYWENILNNVNAITEVAKLRWDWSLLYDANRGARDKAYSRWGGFLDDVPIDPARYGMPPNSLASIDPVQLLCLECARQALEDAGYGDRDYPRERTSVITGISCGAPALAEKYIIRSNLPQYLKDVPKEMLAQLPDWTEDSFAGVLPNVAPGRVANRLDLGGFNYNVDAACASSMASLHVAVRELEAGTSDLVLMGGADTFMSPYSFMCFAKTLALTGSGVARPFDADADGIVLGEGVAFTVLKRLADAERDGDRIYAVIKAVAGSSDGRDKSIAAPRPEGQKLALRRTYAASGIPAGTVELVECHGTGTSAGERAEVSVLREVYEEGGARPKSCSVGSVKSMIGHTKSAAGVAGLIKAAMALHHKVEPPTLNVRKPNPILKDSPFYLNARSRPWIHSATQYPRRAAVSSFGFGGTNFHAVLEEYEGGYLAADERAPVQSWPSELFVWTAKTQDEIRASIERLGQSLAQLLAAGARPLLRDLAAAVWSEARGREGLTLAVVAASLDDLQKKLDTARQWLSKPVAGTLQDPRGIYYSAAPLGAGGRLAFLFSGQGSPYPGMLCDLAVQFPEVRERFEIADRLLASRFPQALSLYVFPPAAFSEEEEAANMRALMETNVAQPAIGAADMALFKLMGALGVEPAMTAGHSYGEYVALCAAGVFDEKVLYPLSEARGRFIVESAAGDLGTMAAAESERGPVEKVIAPVEGVWIANLNSPKQTVISGTREGVAEAVRLLERSGIATRAVAVSCAFHSPVIAAVQERLAAYLAKLEFAEARLDVYSNTLAEQYPREPRKIAKLLSEHLTKPVEFAREIEAMYAAGARIFVEAGPRRVLTNLTQQILADRDHLALPLDIPGRGGLLQLQHVLAQLAAHGVPLQLDRLFQGRIGRVLDLAELVEATRAKVPSPTTWLVNGGRAKPIHKEDKEVVRTGFTTQETIVSAPQKKAPPPEPQPQHRPAPEPGLRAPAEPPRSAASGPASAGAAQAPAASSSVAASAAQPAAANPGPADRGGFPPRAAEPQHRAAAPAAADLDDVSLLLLQSHQQLMQRFLETQQAVMLAFLQGGDLAAAPPRAPAAFAAGAAEILHQGAPAPHAPPEAVGAAAAPLGAPAAAPVGAPAAAPVGAPAAAPAPPPAPAVQRGPAVEASPPPPSAPTAAPAPPALAPAPPAAPARGASSVDQIRERLLEIVSERTGYPPDMLDLELDLEADLGVDSIKRVEILGVIQQEYPELAGNGRSAAEELGRIKTLKGIVDWIGRSLPAQAGGAPATQPAAPAAASAAAVRPAPAPSAAAPGAAPGAIKARLLEIVSERTGYPPDMLDLDLDLEADLGVDSIKRVEILGVIQQEYPELGRGGSTAAEELGKIKTLQGILDWIGGALPAQPAAQRPPAPAAPAPSAASASASAPGVSPAGETAAPSAGQTAAAVDEIRNRLLEIVSERTGYPPDMLDLDLDLEADLGVDSIKRVEILGVVQQEYPQISGNGSRSAAEELGKIKTLQGILAWIGAALSAAAVPAAKSAAAVPAPGAASASPAGPGSAAADAFPLPAGGTPDREKAVPRFVLASVEAPIMSSRTLAVPAGAVFMLTDDEEGVAAALADELRSQGGQTALVRMSSGVREDEAGLYSADLADHDSVQRLVELVRERQGPIAGVVHLLPLKAGPSFTEMSLAAWRQHLDENVKSLFFLAKAASADIKAAAQEGSGWLIAATSVRGGYDKEIVAPGHGGLAGLVKTIAEEWLSVCCKTVDFDQLDAGGAAGRLLDEMALRGGDVEIYYRGGRRFVLRTDLAEFGPGAAPVLEIGSDWVLFITGGATGITSAVTLEIAEKYRPILVLAGIETWPEGAESPATAGIKDERELKAAIIDEMKKAGRKLTLNEVERAYRTLLRDREMRDNVAAFERAGSKVSYHHVDVTDAEAFGALIDGIYEEYGRIDGVIHGAGIIQDKLIEDKTPESFDRVFDTKADSAFILSQKLRADSLKFLVFYSSVAGRFGNRGQCDYSACNETVGRLAALLDWHWPGRIISANWGPWETSAAGMVSDGVGEQFASRGVKLIPRRPGARALEREIRFGRKNEVEIVFGNGPWALAPGSFPLLADAAFKRTNGAVEVVRRIDPERDVYLKDHMLDEKPVLPAAVALELMAETAQRGWIERMLVGVDALQFFRGVVLEEGPRDILVSARPIGEGDPANNELIVQTIISDPANPNQPFYRANVILGRRPHLPPAFDAAPFADLPAFPMTLDETYRKWLFHGARLQGITEMKGMSGAAISGMLIGSTPALCLAGETAGQWLADPVVVDSAFQLVLMWERGNHDMTGLPSRIATYRCHGAFHDTSIRCCISARTANQGQHLMTNIYFIDPAGRLLAAMEGAEFSCSAALNRLTEYETPYRGIGR